MGLLIFVAPGAYFWLRGDRKAFVARLHWTEPALYGASTLVGLSSFLIFSKHAVLTYLGFLLSVVGMLGLVWAYFQIIIPAKLR